MLHQPPQKQKQPVKAALQQCRGIVRPLYGQPEDAEQKQQQNRVARKLPGKDPVKAGVTAADTAPTGGGGRQCFRPAHEFYGNAVGFRPTGTHEIRAGGKRAHGMRAQKAVTDLPHRLFEPLQRLAVPQAGGHHRDAKLMLQTEGVYLHAPSGRLIH